MQAASRTQSGRVSWPQRLSGATVTQTGECRDTNRGYLNYDRIKNLNETNWTSLFFLGKGGVEG